MKTKYFAYALAAAAVLLGAGIAQADTMLWSYDFDSLNLGRLTNSAGGSQDGWDRYWSLTSTWEDAYVVEGTGFNTTQMLGRNPSPTKKGAEAYHLLNAPIEFSPGDSVDLYFQVNVLKANALVGLSFENQSAPHAYGLAGIEFKLNSATTLRTYMRSYNSLGNQEYRGIDNAVSANTWYEFKYTYDFDSSGALGSLAYRLVQEGYEDDEFEPITELTNKALGITMDGGKYKAVGVTVRTDLDVLSGCSLYVDNIGLGAPVPIPEPSTLALLACGLIGLLAYAWRKRK